MVILMTVCGVLLYIAIGFFSAYWAAYHGNRTQFAFWLWPLLPIMLGVAWLSDKVDELQWEADVRGRHNRHNRGP